MRSFLLPLLLVTLTPHSLRAETVAVLSAGEDPATSGSLQSEIEAQLRLLPGLTVLGAAELGRVLSDGQADPDPDAAARGAAAALVIRAEKHYFDARLAEAERDAVAAEEALARIADASRERAGLLVLRAAIRAKEGDPAGAEKLARAALLLDPAIAPRSFPPSVEELLDRVRLTLPSRVLLRVLPAPEQAAVTVDGRAPDDGIFVVVPGVHHVTVRAPGYRTVVRTIEVTEETTARIPLVVRLPGDVDRALAGAVWGGEAATAKLDAIAKRADADRLVVVSARGAQARAILHVPRRAPAAGGPFVVGSAAASRPLTEWVVAAVKGARSPSAAARNPAKQPEAVIARKPLQKRPVVWGVVGAALLAVLAGGAVAASSSRGSESGTTEGTTLGGGDGPVFRGSTP